MMTFEEKMTIFNDSFSRLRSLGVIKTYQDFARLLDVAKNSISAAKNGNETYLTDSLISKIQDVMARCENDDIDKARSAAKTIKLNEGQDTILVIPTSARGGSLGDFSDSVQAYECERIISPVQGADFAMMVTGDSMSPEYPNGSHILIKKIDEKQFIEWGKVFVLDTSNGPVIKQVFPTATEGVVECRSINPCFPPFKVQMADIFGWYRVLMAMSLK